MEADLVVEVHRVLLCGLLVPVARRPSLDQVLTGTPSKDNKTLQVGLYKRKTTAQNFLGQIINVSLYLLFVVKEMFENKIQILNQVLVLFCIQYLSRSSFPLHYI